MCDSVCRRLCLLEVLGALDMLEVTLCMPEATKGELYLLDVLDAPEAMRCVLLCMPEALEGEVWT